MFSLATFEHQLVMYVAADDKAVFSNPFDISTVPVVSHEQALAEERTKKLTSATPTLKAPTTTAQKPQANGITDNAAAAAAQSQKHSEQLAAIPELSGYGPVSRPSAVVELTESETEYVVSVVKHIFKEHVVLQYDIKNTLPETVLEEVSVVATPADDELLEEEFIIPVAQLATDVPGTVYVSFKKTADGPFVSTSFTNTLKFTSKEIDPTTNEPDAEGYEDEYQVEDLELTGSDYVLPAYAGSFDHVWEQVGANGEEASENLQLGNVKSIAGKSPRILLPHCPLLTSCFFFRCYGATAQGLVDAAARWHGRCVVHEHAHPQALREVSIWGPGGCAGQIGVLGKVRGHDANCGAQRGGGPRGVGRQQCRIALVGKRLSIDRFIVEPKRHASWTLHMLALASPSPD